MKLFSAAALFLVVALAAASTENSSCTNSDSNDEIEETLARDKRTIGLDENFKKEVEIKHKSGASLKVSTNFSFNDGGVIAHLPAVLDSITDNKIRFIEQLHKNHNYHGINQVGGHVTAGSQVNANFGTSIFGHHGNLKALLAAKHELLMRKLANIGHHEKLHDGIYGRKLGGLNDFFAAHHGILARKNSGKTLAALPNNKPADDSCSPTGTYSEDQD